MKPRKTKADVQREYMELNAQRYDIYHWASKDLYKASTDHMMASAVIVKLQALGGRDICLPFGVADGLSKETIAALKKDMIRSQRKFDAYRLPDA